MSMYLQTAIEDATAVELPPYGAFAEPDAAPIEGYRSDPTASACATGPQAGARALAQELAARYGGRAEIFACRPVRGAKRMSLHGEGRAVDWFRNVKDAAEADEARRILDWLLATDAQGNEHALARRMGIQELIYDGRIWTARRHAEGWRAYKGVNPHTDHIHIGMNWPGARMQTSHWAGRAAAQRAVSERDPMSSPAKLEPPTKAQALGGPARAKLPANEEAEWERRAAVAAKRIDDAGHKPGQPLRGAGTAPVDAGVGFPRWFMSLQHKLSMSMQWQQEEEDAQRLLRDYATRHMSMHHGVVLPANLRFLLEYLGRSSINDAKARPKYRGVAVFGGGVDAKGKPTSNWCTAATTRGVLNGLKQIGYAPSNSTAFLNPGRKTLNGQPLTLGSPGAYAAPLMPGDMVMYLFDKCQYGGHTVTVVEDLGDSFTHISGNTGDAIGLGLGEAGRLTTPPPNFNLGRASRYEPPEEKARSTQYIATLSFGKNMKLVYSIVRFGAVFAELERLPTLSPSEQQKILTNLGLRKVPPAAAG